MSKRAFGAYFECSLVRRRFSRTWSAFTSVLLPLATGPGATAFLVSAVINEQTYNCKQSHDSTRIACEDAGIANAPGSKPQSLSAWTRAASTTAIAHCSPNSTTARSRPRRRRRRDGLSAPGGAAPLDGARLPELGLAAVEVERLQFDRRRARRGAGDPTETYRRDPDERRCRGRRTTRSRTARRRRDAG